MNEQIENSARGGNHQPAPARRNLPRAGFLALLYAALFALLWYLQSSGIENHISAWLLWPAGVIWFAIMMVLPFLVVKHLGVDLSPLRPELRFSLRNMLIQVAWVSLFVWFFTQVHWKIQRSLWRSANHAAVNSTPAQSPLGLRLVGETGESRIEIKNGTKEQLSKAKRLFPEATVIPVPDAPSSGGP